MSEAAFEYLNYMREVLGVRQVVRPKEHDPVAAHLPERATTRTGHWPEAGEFDLLILHQGEGFFAGPGAELWAKMRAAMNLGSVVRVLETQTLRDDVEGVLLELLEIYPSAVSLVLTSSPARGESRVLGVSKVVETFAPGVLLQSPDLKRQAWADLQTAMRALGAMPPGR